MSMNSGIESDFDGESDDRSPVIMTAWWVAPGKDAGVGAAAGARVRRGRRVGL
ncbi:MAG: hypothetical protein HC782_00580 [Gammaproteobacteria bacterium]|nr:hypothetical protein [Gammaproteobacteria bacterium]